MEKEQVHVALAAGLALTDPQTDLLETFRKHAAGILMLRQLLIGMSTGAVALSSVTQEDTPADPDSKTPADPKREALARLKELKAPANKGPVPKQGAKKRAKRKKK